MLHYPGFMALALVFVLSACSSPNASIVAPEGKLSILDVSPGFSPDDLPKDWVVEGDSDVVNNQLSVVLKDNVKALKITNYDHRFVVVRRTRAMLLATPYLTWAWNMEPHASGFHPVRVVVGFHVGKQKSGSWRRESTNWLGSNLPTHNRAMAFIWGDTALQRGRLIKPSADGRTAPLYTVRGGRENAGSWWLEAVDLSDLYTRVWPNDDLGKVQVTFIGVASSAGREPSAAYVSEIKLSR